MANNVILYSGGLDSFVAWRLLGEPKAVYFSIGHPYESNEIANIEKMQVYLKENYSKELSLEVIKRLTIGDLQFPDGHIPYRNLFFALLAALEYDNIYLGALAGETSRDKSGYFFKQSSRLISYIENKSVKIIAPFRNYTKTELVRRYIKEFPQDIDLLLHTRSCYSDEPMPVGIQGCGRCMACFRRWVAMHNNGIQEEYLQTPYTWDNANISKVSIKNWLGYIKNMDYSESYGVIRNNWQAYKALKSIK